MKKLFLSIVLLLFCFTVNAQFGASFGYESSKAKVSGDESFTTGYSGSLSIGLFYESDISNKLDLLSSFDFGIGEKVGDESNNTIAVGLDLQYYPAGKEYYDGFFIQPGIGFGYSLRDMDDGRDAIVGIGLSGSIGLGFDLSEKLTVIGSYRINLSDSSNIDGITTKISGFGASLLYKFKFRNK